MQKLAECKKTSKERIYQYAGRRLFSFERGQSTSGGKGNKRRVKRHTGNENHQFFYNA